MSDQPAQIPVAPLSPPPSNPASPAPSTATAPNPLSPPASADPPSATAPPPASLPAAAPAAAQPAQGAATAPSASAIPSAPAASSSTTSAPAVSSTPAGLPTSGASSPSFPVTPAGPVSSPAAGSPIGTPLASLDHPLGAPLDHHEQPTTLSHSAAVREATMEEAAPRHVDQAHDPVAAVRLGNAPVRVAASVLQNDFHPPHAELPSTRINIPAGAHPADLRPGVASPVMPTMQPELNHKPTTEIRAGYVQKPFYIHTQLLMEKSPFFAEMKSTAENPQPPHRLSGPFFYPDLDEFAFAHFVRWIYGGELHGPHDFHSMNHYVCLYVLSKRFQIEKLQNHVMDLIREYYAAEDMTSPPFRLEYIYEHTTAPDIMREFLVRTAAYRAFIDVEDGKQLSDSMKGVLKKEGDVAPDFVQALLYLIKSDREDARHGDPCRWHEHTMTPKCPPFVPEVFLEVWATLPTILEEVEAEVAPLY